MKSVLREIKYGTTKIQSHETISMEIISLVSDGSSVSIVFQWKMGDSPGGMLLTLFPPIRGGSSHRPSREGHLGNIGVSISLDDY